MNLHDDFTRRVVVDSESLDWLDSPLPGVQRRMLERDGGEVARATSIVRYAPGSRFSRHVHAGGEEFLVLEGVFSDHSGDFHPGTYVRNPPGSSHAPHSDAGCIIFVKLRQMEESDQARVCVDSRTAPWRPGDAPGLEVLPLHAHGAERVALVRFAPGASYGRHEYPRGEEILVLEGAFEDERGRYPRGTWLRNPPGSVHTPSSESGCCLYLKTGHLTR